MSLNHYCGLGRHHHRSVSNPSLEEQMHPRPIDRLEQLQDRYQQLLDQKGKGVKGKGSSLIPPQQQQGSSLSSLIPPQQQEPLDDHTDVAVHRNTPVLLPPIEEEGEEKLLHLLNNTKAACLSWGSDLEFLLADLRSLLSCRDPPPSPPAPPPLPPITAGLPMSGLKELVARLTDRLSSAGRDENISRDRVHYLVDRSQELWARSRDLVVGGGRLLMERGGCIAASRGGVDRIRRQVEGGGGGRETPPLLQLLADRQKEVEVVEALVHELSDHLVQEQLQTARLDQSLSKGRVWCSVLLTVY